MTRLALHRPNLMTALLTSPRQWANLQREVTPWPAHVAVHIASPEVLEAVAGFPIHRGCIALAECPAPAPPELGDDGPGWWLGMEGINDHDNVGSLLRIAWTLGARGVLQDPTCADPLYRRSVRVSMGAAFLLPRWSAPVHELIARCREHGVRTAALTPGGDRVLEWGDRPFEGDRWALWIGAEGPGLTEKVLADADLCLRIPIADRADSLNVAVAAALAAWAFQRARSQ